MVVLHVQPGDCWSLTANAAAAHFTNVTVEAQIPVGVNGSTPLDAPFQIVGISSSASTSGGGASTDVPVRCAIPADPKSALEKSTVRWVSEDATTDFESPYNFTGQAGAKSCPATSETNLIQIWAIKSSFDNKTGATTFANLSFAFNMTFEASTSVTCSPAAVSTSVTPTSTSQGTKSSSASKRSAGVTAALVFFAAAIFLVL